MFSDWWGCSFFLTSTVTDSYSDDKICDSGQKSKLSFYIEIDEMCKIGDGWNVRNWSKNEKAKYKSLLRTFVSFRMDKTYTTILITTLHMLFPCSTLCKNYQSTANFSCLWCRFLCNFKLNNSESELSSLCLVCMKVLMVSVKKLGSIYCLCGRTENIVYTVLSSMSLVCEK